MLRVLVCGEGKHDIGASDIPSKEGWLQPVLRQVADTEIKFGTISRNRLVLQRRTQKHFRPLPPGHGAKALFSKLIAAPQGYNLVVFMVDTDSNKRSDWRRIRSQIIDGFDRKPDVEVKGVPCVPMSTSESWLLADKQAWQKIGLADLAVLPKKPENLWGKPRDPQSNHPHQFFRRVCIEAEVPDSRETRVQLADFSNIGTLQSACPTSFAVFAEDTKSALVAISSP